MDQANGQIVDIGSCRAGDNQVSNCLQRMIGIIIFKMIPDIHPPLLQLSDGITIHVAPAASVGPSVPSEPTLISAAPGIPSSACAAARANS